jgi:hypothetical protein
MQISVQNDGNFLPPQIRDKAIEVIKTSLNRITTTNDRFEINDSLFYREQRSGKIRPCVMNSASYISSKFQSNLAAIERCAGETKIGDQAIDGYCDFPFEGAGFRIRDRDKLLTVIHGYIQDKKLDAAAVYTLFPMFYGMFAENRILYDIKTVPEQFHPLFKEEHVKTRFRLGVEFETGNIGSSFRAINKLFILFQQQEIDAGIFVSCTDKPNAAGRIWPVTNRNGSFQELKKRNYQDQVSLPLICIGFAPDAFSGQAPFLGKKGTLYTTRDSKRIHPSGKYKIMLGENKEEVLYPIE